MVWLSVGVGLSGVVALFWRCGSRDILPYLAAYFMLFGLGPAVNVALAAPTYWQIDQSQIGKASMGVALGVAGLSVVGLLMPPTKGAVDAERLRSSTKQFPLVPVILFGLAFYALAILATRAPELLATDKLGRIDLAGRWHYPYVLCEMFACSLYFLARQHSLSRIAYWMNFACYVSYCLVTQERDFLFGIFAILLHIRLFRRRVTIIPLLCAGGASVLIATYMTSLRSGDSPFGFSESLNEGSVMIVDTLVMGIVPSSVPYSLGETYVNALGSLIPNLFTAREPSLADWLMSIVAPGASGGYGFSMTAEAYMNFGIAFIPVVFAAHAFAQRRLVARVGRNNFLAYLNILFTITWMYNFRGESRAILATLTYGALFYLAIELTSIKTRFKETGERTTIRGKKIPAPLATQQSTG